MVIIKKDKGMEVYIEEEIDDVIIKNGVVVGYDGRNKSRRWDELNENVIMKNKINVRLL